MSTTLPDPIEVAEALLKQDRHGAYARKVMNHLRKNLRVKSVSISKWSMTRPDTVLTRRYTELDTVAALVQRAANPKEGWVAHLFDESGRKLFLKNPGDPDPWETKHADLWSALVLADTFLLDWSKNHRLAYPAEAMPYDALVRNRHENVWGRVDIGPRLDLDWDRDDPDFEGLVMTISTSAEVVENVNPLRWKVMPKPESR